MTKPLRLALLAAFALAAMAVRAQACNVECNEGEAYNDAAELCMPIGSFSLWTGLGAGIWVTVLTVIGYTIGFHTASMSYAELVHTGTGPLRARFQEGLFGL